MSAPLHFIDDWLLETKLEGHELKFGYSGSLPSLGHTKNFLHVNEVKKIYPFTFVDTDRGEIPTTVDFATPYSSSTGMGRLDVYLHVPLFIFGAIG